LFAGGQRLIFEIFLLKIFLNHNLKRIGPTFFMRFDCKEPGSPGNIHESLLKRASIAKSDACGSEKG
jgi:hypothetical protein